MKERCPNCGCEEDLMHDNDITWCPECEYEGRFELFEVKE